MLHQKPLSDALKLISPGQVQAVLCKNTTSDLAHMLAAVNDMQWQRAVTHIWDLLPNQRQVIADVVKTLAQVSFELWPAWYQQDELFIESGLSATDALMNQHACSALQATREHISLPWLKTAVQACQHQKVPFLRDFPLNLQLTQLAFALESDGLILTISDPQPSSHCLLGLAKAATWIASHTNSRIILILPESLATSNELESILYGAITLSTVESVFQQPQTSQEAKHTIFPIHGRPHPFSPGEQKLDTLLAQDTELASLFKFNQRLQSVRLSDYVVDLLWPEGRVVVEIDGYRHHGNRFGFSSDRNRDYELLISDYIVLRLPHDEVMSDAEVAIEKIRDVVRFRRQQLPSLREVR